MFSRRLCCLVLITTMVAPTVLPAGEISQESVTLILGAQTREIALLRSNLEGRKDREILGLTFWEGRLAGRRVAIAVMASGKVNAAMFTSLAISQYSPSEVIVTGIAGGINPELRPGDIVIASKVVHHDVGRVWDDRFEHRSPRSPLGGRYPMFMQPPERLLALAERAAEETELLPIELQGDERPVRVLTGVVATGDAFIASEKKSSEIREQLGADAVEMEGAAVHQICETLGIPCIMIRSMSDNANNNAHIDLRRFADTAATNSANIVLEIVRLLNE
jgi:adenosylhomocysteine nucleosidase